ncbi:MAG TPA: putative quinol monooxygenase [Polyangiales bacterium]
MVVTARLTAAAGNEAALEQLFAELSAQVRQNEPGCLLYCLCKSKDPGVYVVVERYQDQAALTVHGNSAHFKAAMPKIGACLAGAPELEFLQEVG